MANHNRDDLENQGNASLGILGVLGAVAVAAGVNASNNKKKEKVAAQNAAQKAQLKTQYEGQLRTVQSKLSNYRSKFMSSILYSDEISALEKKERELINAINQL